MRFKAITSSVSSLAPQELASIICISKVVHLKHYLTWTSKRYNVFVLDSSREAAIQTIQLVLQTCGFVDIQTGEVDEVGWEFFFC